MTDDPRADDPTGEPEGSPQHRAEGAEPRVRDIVSGNVTRDELDPETIAQLAAWFGAPAQSVVQAERAHARGQGDPGAGPPSRGPGLPPAPGVGPYGPVGIPDDPDALTHDHPDDNYDDPEIRALWRRRRRAMRAVDPDFLAYFESLKTRGDDNIRLPDPPVLALETPLASFDIHAWRLNFLGIREWEIDEDLYDDLRERTPQALLRDLHRPVTTWPLALESTDLGVDVGGLRSQASIRGTMQARYSICMDEYRLASVQGREQLEVLRDILETPWEESYIPESERKSTKITAEDFKWFSSIGYDPFA